MNASYTRIAAAIKMAPRYILFLSDVVEELDAARDHTRAENFEQIKL